MQYFYSSISPHYLNVYKILTNSAMEHNNERVGATLTLLTKNDVISKWRLIMSPAIWLFLVKLIITGKFFTNEIVHVKYKGYSLGRYAVPAALRSAKSFESKLSYYLNLLKSIVKAAGLLEFILPYSKNIEAAYLEHMCYENGVLCEVFTELDIPIYHTHYPYNFVRWLGNGKQGFEDAVRVPYSNRDEDIIEGKRVLNEVLNDTSRIPYMGSAPFEKINTSTINYDYIIYCHSFTDAQMNYGYDGAFMSVYEWLEFTLEYLKDKKVCLKAHPNFYAKGYTSDVIEWDRKLFSYIITKYKNNPNIIFIDYALKNDELLAEINKDAVLISHHGNALLEGGALGFKCISSVAAPWENYNIFNTWSNKKQYIQLLEMDFDKLTVTNMTQLYTFCGRLYDEKIGIYGDRNVGKIMSDAVGCSLAKYIRNPGVMDNITGDDLSSLTSKLKALVSEC